RRVASVTDGRPTIWTRFVDQVERTPAAVAAGAGDESLTYEELHDRARRVAADLARYGAERDAVVAVFGQRGLDWLAAMLGACGRGAVYLPLEPRWPVARVAHVLERAAVRVVVGSHDVPPALRGLVSGEHACSWLPVRGGGPHETIADVSVAAED